ncbi:MAG: hypothetical protein WCP19_05955 [Chloroflexota bacterium]
MIKKISLILMMCLFILASACQANASPAAPAAQGSADVENLIPKPGEKSMKGFELYSWQENGEWYFSVLIGTNRQKTDAEIHAPAATLRGLTGLQKMLRSIPAGETVSMVFHDPANIPPDDIVAKVQNMCTQLGLDMTGAR